MWTCRRRPGCATYATTGPAIQRRRAGKGFVYLDAKGRRVANPDTLKRIRSLVIPPAWTDVWICASADGHIQATGRDAKGRKQYKYHAEYREAREQSKYEHLFAFAAALPTIRATVAEHMSLRGLPREKVLATVVHLLETTLIRVGNDEYARNNQSYGLTTLRSDHVAVEGSEVRFQFTGKSGKQWSLAMRDRRVARIVRACQELPGQDLLQYFDERQNIARRLVRRRQCLPQGDHRRRHHRQGFSHLGRNDVDGATSLDLRAIHERNAGQARDERGGEESGRGVGNTAAVCRKSYIHPAISDAYLSGAFALEVMEESVSAKSADLRAEEIAVLALLKAHEAPAERPVVTPGRRGGRGRPDPGTGVEASAA